MVEKIGGCPVCGCPESSPGFLIRGYQYLSCNNCRMLYLEDDVVGTGSYNAEYFQRSLTRSLTGYPDYQRQERPLRKNFKRYLKKVLPYLHSERPSMLDVGCAYGFLLDEARRLGFRVHGVDLSEDAIKWMNANLGIEGTAGLLADAPAGPFDVVTVSEVIEHIGNPVLFVSELHERLADKGVLVIVTGACDASCAKLLGKTWWYLNPPDHCSIYSRAALRMLVSKAGFQVIYHGMFPYHWVGLNNGLLKLARMLGSGRLGRISLKLPSLMIPIPHGTTQFLIARKQCR